MKKQKKSFSYPTSFQSKKYPEFMRNNIFLKAYPKPEKVFSKLGIKNASFSVGSIEITDYNHHVVLLNQIYEALHTVRGKNFNHGKFNYDPANITNVIEDFVDDCDRIREHMINDEYSGYGNDDRLDYESFIDKNELIFPFQYKGFQIKTDKNESFINVIGRIKDFCIKHNLEWKELFSIDLDSASVNAAEIVPFNNKKLKVRFATEGQQGSWDIATMSMRGITSCQSWTSGHKTNLIGSLLDPNTALIYLTDGTKTKYGEKMIARSVVRYVKTHRGNKPHLFLEHVYANRKDLSGPQQAYIQAIFAQCLEDNLTKNIPIVYGFKDYNGDGMWENKFYIPLSEPIEQIEELTCNNDYDSDYQDEGSFLSYRDSLIGYE